MGSAHEVEMLLQPSGGNSREPDLPLDTAEQIQHSLAVDFALENRAKRRQREVETQTAQFRSLAEKIVFFFGLLFTVAFFCCSLDLWLTGDAVRAMASLGTSGTLGGANWMLFRRTRGK